MLRSGQTTLQMSSSLKSISKSDAIAGTHRIREYNIIPLDLSASSILCRSSPVQINPIDRQRTRLTSSGRITFPGRNSSMLDGRCDDGVACGWVLLHARVYYWYFRYGNKLKTIIAVRNVAASDLYVLHVLLIGFVLIKLWFLNRFIFIVYPICQKNIYQHFNNLLTTNYICYVHVFS